MPRHAETRRLPYTPEQMFDLVADVARYPEFLPWVVAVRVRLNTPAELVADMAVGFKGLRETFTSRVVKQRSTQLNVDYVEGPMKHLRNEWRFTPEDDGCRLDFSVDFAFRNRLFERLVGQVFGAALRRMSGAFEERAAKLYGSGSGGISISSAHTAA